MVFHLYFYMFKRWFSETVLKQICKDLIAGWEKQISAKIKPPASPALFYFTLQKRKGKLLPHTETGESMQRHRHT